MKISVVIPAYNASGTLGRAIDSVISQSLRPSEIIVVNDGSIDETLAVARRYCKTVQVIDMPHCGVSAARNRGIDASSGDWIAFLDADDEWKPQKLAVQIAKSTEQSDAMVVASGAEYERNGRIYKITGAKRVGRLARELLLTNFLNTSTVMVKRLALESPRARFPVGVGFGEDWEYWITLASAHDFMLIPDVLVKTFRISSNSSAAVDADAFAGALGATYDRLRRNADLAPLIEEMWETLSANIQFQKANFVYDHGEVWKARKILMDGMLGARRIPSASLALKIFLMPLALRNRINRLAARR